MMDADLRGSFVAIQRAAQQARRLAVQTGTDLIVFREGRIVRVSPANIDLSQGNLNDWIPPARAAILSE